MFTNEKIFRQLETLLNEQLVNHQTASDAYLFMPDHAHILLTGNDNNADVYNCIVKFKQHSGYLFRKVYPHITWQKDFYDHILRKEEDAATVVRYILNNPVRKEMIEDWKSYPYKGSSIYNFNEWD